MSTFTFQTVMRGSLEDCLLSITNNDPNDVALVTVKNLNVREKAWYTGTPGLLTITRTTFQSGGVAIPVVKGDLGAADLPSQVQLALGPAVNITGAIIKSWLPLPQSLGPGTATTLSYKGAGKLSGRALADHLSSSSRDANVQKFAIREGEGICWDLPSDFVTSSVYPMAWQVVGFVRNATTGKTYYFCEAIFPESGDQAPLGFFNGSGSGATFEVVVQLYDFGVPPGVTLGTDVPYLRYTAIGGDNGGGTLIPLVPHRVGDVPIAGVAVRAQANIGLPLKFQEVTSDIGLNAASALGYPLSNQSIYRALGGWGHRLMYQGIQAPAVPIGTFLQGQIKGRAMTRGLPHVIVLRSGEGLGIVNGGFDGTAVYEVSGQIVIPSASIGYARSRVVNR